MLGEETRRGPGPSRTTSAAPRCLCLAQKDLSSSGAAPIASSCYHDRGPGRDTGSLATGRACCSPRGAPCKTGAGSTRADCGGAQMHACGVCGPVSARLHAVRGCTSRHPGRCSRTSSRHQAKRTGGNALEKPPARPGERGTERCGGSWLGAAAAPRWTPQPSLARSLCGMFTAAMLACCLICSPLIEQMRCRQRS